MAGSSSGGGGGGGGGVPPGFRFHPTDEELLHFYLKKKVSFQKFEMDVIREVDLNKIEPWELAERCKIGSTPQNEWYFFSHKDRKYPTGSRTNRATHAGFWKATGRDKCIRNTFKKIGMRKTLVFYRGRAPHGQKTDWIMHEYRLEDSDHHHHHDNVNEPPPPPNEDGWVVCRVFKKKNLFKIGSSSNAAQGETGSVLMPNTNNYNNNQYDLLQHQHQHQHQHQPAADLNYSHIPLHYPQLESHAFNHLKPPLMLTNYDHHPLPTTAAPDYDPPMMQVKQFMSSNTTTTRDDHSCECDQSSSQPAMLQLRDDHQWDPLSNPHHQDSNINQINLRSEMDFWAYGK